MPLAANSKLGPYEIKSTLGVGGMGEVYRARGSRLNRDVAIKVLRQDSTTGASADLRSRFEREARAVAALSQPRTGCPTPQAANTRRSPSVPLRNRPSTSLPDQAS